MSVIIQLRAWTCEQQSINIIIVIISWAREVLKRTIAGDSDNRPFQDCTLTQTITLHDWLSTVVFLIWILSCSLLEIWRPAATLMKVQGLLIICIISDVSTTIMVNALTLKQRAVVSCRSLGSSAWIMDK